VTAALVFAIDQATKAAARAYLALAPPIPIVPGVFELSYVHNRGAAFGLMAGMQPLFIVTSLLVLGGIAYVWFRYHPNGGFIVLALGLVCGGAVGNLVDRAVSGQVTDFFYLHFWPVFNIADSAIVVGVSILVIWLLFHADEAEVAPEAPDRAEDGEHPDGPAAGGDVTHGQGAGVG
jgi:signal peptidase II